MVTFLLIVLTIFTLAAISMGCEAAYDGITASFKRGTFFKDLASPLGFFAIYIVLMTAAILIFG